MVGIHGPGRSLDGTEAAHEFKEQPVKFYLLLMNGANLGIGGTTFMPEQGQTDEQKAVRIFQVAELQKERADGRGPWLEFLRSDDLYCGIYELSAESHDGQRPHQDDEVYYVLSGKAAFESDGKKNAIGQGSVIFVARHADHRFVDIEEDISLLVFFATSPKAKKKDADPAAE